MGGVRGAGWGLLAFAIGIRSGLTAGNTVETKRSGAIQAMFIFFALGLVVGWIAYRVIDEHSLREHRELFPDGELASIPSSQETGDEGAPKMVS